MGHRLVVLVSGSGSNLQAIIDAIATGELDAEIKLVVSNRKNAFALQRAEAATIPAIYLPLKPFLAADKPREAYDAELAAQISEFRPDLIVLAGWMHIFSTAFLDQFAGKIINLHPALPGTFPGAHAIDDAFAAFQRGEITRTGCMVHLVVPEVDAGPAISQAVVEILPADTLEDLSVRIHAAEHKIIVEAIESYFAATNSAPLAY